MFFTYTLIVDIWLLGEDRNLWTIKMFRSFEISTVIFSLQYLFPAASVRKLAAISLERTQASPHQKEDIWSSCCGCLVYSCPVFSYRFFTIFPGPLRYHYFLSRASIILAIAIVLPFYGRCFLLVHCYQTLLWNSSTTCNQ